MEPFLVQALRHRSHRLPCRAQLGDPRPQPGISCQLFVGLHGTRQAMPADKASGPVDGHLDLVGFPLHADLDLFDQEADQSLSLC